MCRRTVLPRPLPRLGEHQDAGGRAIDEMRAKWGEAGT
jgi:hypothetical protein